ncbi:KamA family radical SAM protein [Deltaproteobacteria bacterium TL4]
MESNLVKLKNNDEEPPLGQLSSLASPSYSISLEKLKSLSSPAEDEYPTVINPKTEKFRQRFFPYSTPELWNSWIWQIRNRIQNIETVSSMLQLSENEKSAIECSEKSVPLSITPYYASLLDEFDPKDPLRMTVIPVTEENIRRPEEDIDPLSENCQSPVPGLIQRYPDRVLFMVTGFCSTYCRYCTRSRILGHQEEYRFTKKRWEQALKYIERTPVIRDVLLSGGDALTLSDDSLEWLLFRLRQIPHVEFIRIGTKVPVVLPQRITPQLVQMLHKYHPLWMSIHFTHPNELTPEVKQACSMLSDAGIPLGSQTVLLKGVNDDVETMKKLMHGLLRFRVRPYYIYQCDPVVGSSHFRTPVKKGLEIIAGLRGYTSGYAVPTYVIDAPGGGGKIPVHLDSILGYDGNNLLLKNYEGKTVSYPDDPTEKINWSAS